MTDLMEGLPWWLRQLITCLQCRKPGFDPWVGKIPWKRKGYLLQDSCLENFIDRGVWRATVHGFAELDTTEQVTLLRDLTSNPKGRAVQRGNLKITMR